MLPVSNVRRVPYRPQIRRMSHRELHETQSSNEFDTPSMASTNRWLNRRQSQVVPEGYYPWRPIQRPPKMPTDNDKDKPFFRRGSFWLFGGVFCLILIIAIIAIVLGIVLPMTTTTAATNGNATPKMLLINSEDSASITCSTTDRGLLALLNESISSGWISYSYNYSATKTAPTLLFGFETDDNHTYFLDAVSVVDNSAPSIELLSNPSFENSTINATNWIKSCETTCTNQIVTGSQCFGASGNCFMTYCTVGYSSISFLSQSFMATIGNTYTISFMLNYEGNSNTDSSSFYLDII